MKNRIIPFVLLFLAAGVNAEELPFWRNLDVYSLGGETARTEIVFSPTREAAMSSDIKSFDNYLCLNGIWDFKYFDDSRACPEKFWTEINSWDTIKVPGNWEVQGFGVPIYVNQPYEFPPVWNVTPPVLPDETPLGVYKHTFTLPEQWAGREIFLNFAGVKGGAYYYLNGEFIGYNEDAKDAVRFNVTKYLKPGKNELALKVYRWSTGSYLECMDFWRISGIERDVYLSTEKKDYGFDFNVVSTLASDLKTGEFRLDLTSRIPVKFSAELLSANGKAVASFPEQTLDKTLSLSATIPNVLPWSAEKPDLYTLVMKVGDEWATFDVGFRRFEFSKVTKDGREYPVLLVNGQPVKFKGVNYHEHSPYTGHYVDRELLIKDLKLMKSLNINAIRTSHYPQQREFYELCDKFGFYVYSDANIESHGIGYRLDRTLGNQPQWYDNHRYRIINMYKRLRNYPCMTILSLGNEAGNGYNFYRCYEELKALEKDGMNRPVCYERAEKEWNTDMYVCQYPDAAWFKKQGDAQWRMPIVPSEYSHAMGNSNGSLDLQWESIYKYPHLQGGFIWDWVDQGLDAKTAQGVHFWAYGGDYGVNAPSDANFLCNGLVNPDRLVHPGGLEVKYVYQNMDFSLVGETDQNWQVEVFNRHYFKRLEGCKVAVKVYQAFPADGKVKLVSSIMYEVTAAPQSSRTIEVKKPKIQSGWMYYMDIDAYGDNFDAYGQIIFQNADTEFVADAGKDVLKLNETANGVTVSGKHFFFELRDGVVVSYKKDGREIFADGFGLRPNYWRGPTDNDYGNGFPSRTQIWKEAGKHPEKSTYQVLVKGDVAVVTVHYPIDDANSLDVDYSLYPSGVLGVTGKFNSVKTDKPVEIPRIGLRMRVPATDENIEYFARGSHENYQDRFISARYGLYRSTATAQYFPYVRPQENGHHTGCSYLKVGKLVFQSTDVPFEFNALRNSVEDFDSEEALQCDYQWSNYTPADKHDTERARNRMRRQTHISDITPRDYIEVCIDAAHNGVGGFDSWGSHPDPSRELRSGKEYSFSFIMLVK